MVRQRRYVKSVQTRDYSTSQVDPEIVANMKLLARAYDMRPSAKQLRRSPSSQDSS